MKRPALYFFAVLAYCFGKLAGIFMEAAQRSANVAARLRGPVEMPAWEPMPGSPEFTPADEEERRRVAADLNIVMGSMVVRPEEHDLYVALPDGWAIDVAPCGDHVELAVCPSKLGPSGVPLPYACRVRALKVAPVPRPEAP